MGAMVECLRPDSGMKEGRTKRIKLSFRLGGGAGQCVNAENPDFLAESISARTESLL